MKLQFKWEKLAKITRGDSGLAFVALLAIATLLVSLALVGVAALWQASAQAQEPEGSVVTQAENDQVNGENDTTNPEESDSSSSSSESTDSDESASSESSDSGKSDASDKSEKSESASKSADATSAASADADEVSEGEAGSSSAESADSADKEKNKGKRTFKREIKLDDGKHYTITMSFDESAKIPASAKLDVVRVMQTPKGYDASKSEWQGRPTSEENFVSAAKMKTRISELKKALDVGSKDYVFYAEFLGISLTADGKDVKPAKPVEVTIETDAVEASASDAVEMSFYTEKNADALELKNHSGDKAKDKAYKKGAKLTFETKEFSELGIAGVATPLHTEQVGGFDLAVLGPKGTSAWMDLGEIDESVLPEGLGLAAAYELGSEPERSYGTKLWVEAKPGSKAAADQQATEEGVDADADAGASAEEPADAEVDSEAAASAVQQDSSSGEGYLLHDGSASKLFDATGTSKPVAAEAGDTIILTGIASQGDESGEEADGVVDESADADSGDAVDEAVEGDEGVEGGDTDEEAASDEPTEKTTIEYEAKEQSATSILYGTLNAATGGAYSVEVSYGPEAGIPDGATVNVRELTGVALEYAGDSALRALDAEGSTYLRALDITILDAEGNEVEPKAAVDVTIKLKNTSELNNPSIVHLGSNGPEVIDSESKTKKGTTTLDFSADEFSVYVVVQALLKTELTASDGNTYRVTVSFSQLAGIPENAELVVTEVKEGDEGYDAYVSESAAKLGKNPQSLAFAKAFDITLRDPETGAECQPSKDVKVSIELLDEDVRDYRDIDVVHLGGESGNQAQVMNSVVKGEAVEFATDGFSVYVVIGGDAVPRRTYKFFVWSEINNRYEAYEFTSDSGVTTTQQTVRDGEKPVVPQPKATNGSQDFAGWYARKGQSTEFEDNPYDFNTPVKQNEEVELYAVFKSLVNVVFHDQYDRELDTFPIADTRRGIPGNDGKASIKISDLTTTYNGGNDMAFYGWSYTPISTPGSAKDDEGSPVQKIVPDENGCIQVSAETHLYPIYDSIKWLTLWSGPTGSGATFYPAQYYFDGVGPTELPVPERTGYTFLGWYAGTINSQTEEVTYGSIPLTRADGSLINGAQDGGADVYGGHLHLDSNVTLYAKWDSQVEYQIVVWRQKTTDAADLADNKKNYEYAESVTFKAAVGTEVSVPEEYKDYATTPGYAGYAYRGCDDAKPVSAMGDTVLNVYYDVVYPYNPSGKTHTLTFADSVTGADASVMPSTQTLAYQAKPTVPQDLTSKRKHYSFGGWFADPACTIKVDLGSMTMPDHDLTVYAGWEAEWFLVQIDPNYGALYAYNDATPPQLVGSGATWFWEDYNGQPIQEYQHVTRDYVESSSGTWYYVKHDQAYYGDNPVGDRYTYYTQDPGLATEYTTFESAPNVYRYAGWYEVNADGSETPYEFGQRVDHNTALKLHWKKVGNFHLRYLSGNGKFEDNTTEAIDADVYADNAQIVITRSAVAPEGYAFAGWRVKGDSSGSTYGLGDLFTLQSDYAVSVNGKDMVTLEASYVKLGTASIVYDFNGGTVDVGNFDYGHPDGSDVPVLGKDDTSIDAKTATVSHIVNNSDFVLSSGRGLSYSTPNVTLKGWCNKPVYDKNDPECEFYGLGGKYGVDTKEPVTIYAVWGTTVTYHLNGAEGDSVAWGAGWDPSEYTISGDTCTQDIYLGGVVPEPSGALSSTLGKIFRYWMPQATGTDAYDFTTKVTGALDLYAYWDDSIVVPVHAIDASAETMAEKTSADGWTVSNIQAGASEIKLYGAGGTVYAAPPSTSTNYELAFVAAHNRNAEIATISEDEAVSSIYYDHHARHLYVKFADTSKDPAPLDDAYDIYYVYYQKKSLNISYKSMVASGALEDVTDLSSDAPTTTGSLLGNYDMTAAITSPLLWMGEDSGYFAYAIGSADAKNASALSLITTTSNTDASRPPLRIRNTWRGFQYTTGADDNATWVNCGYAPNLYVVHFAQKPTVVMLKVETEGASDVINTPFTYMFEVTQSNQTESVFSGKYTLKNGEAQSAILFYDDSGSGDSVTQSITITQETQNNAFTTVISGPVQKTEPYICTYTADATGGTKTVTFTNSHKEKQVEVHLARVEGGKIICDDSSRNTLHSFAVPIKNGKTFTEALKPDQLYNIPNGYAFGGVVCGSNGEGEKPEVTVDKFGINSIEYGQVEGNQYELLLKDSAGKSMGELGNGKIYYLYYPAPKLQYVKQIGEGDSATLSLIQGSTDGQNPSPTTITYGRESLQMNGKLVKQDELVELPLEGLTISQDTGSAYFKMPPILDDKTAQRYLSYSSIAIGPGLSAYDTSQSIRELNGNINGDCVMQLQIKDNKLQWSFDGQTWNDLGTSKIYAIYTERGYDMQISKIVDTQDSGKNPLFTERIFTVTISSSALVPDKEYDVIGWDAPKVKVNDNRAITITVVDGSKVKISGLPNTTYAIAESNNDNFSLSAKTGPIVGTPTEEPTITDSAFTLTLDTEKQAVLTNTPMPICKITDNHLFYTLRDAVNYVVDNIASHEATIEMLNDYLVPSADTMTIPKNVKITLTTAKTGAHQYPGSGRAVLSRDEGVAGAPLITNNGELTLVNITLDGKSVSASEPMVKSSDNLVVQYGTTLQNAVNSGNGGAISATGNVSFTSTDDQNPIILSNNQAANGGLLYYTGTGAVSVSGSTPGVSITGNKATNGNGGAIYATGGTVSVTGGTIGGTVDGVSNTATNGNGGAIYAENAAVEIGSNASIVKNRAKNGGAVYSAAGAVSIAKSAVISANNAVEDGGAIYAGTGAVTMSGGGMTGNSVGRNGGAIYAASGSVSVTGGTIGGTAETSPNTAANGNGGAIYAESAPIAIGGSASVVGNSAQNGGAAYSTSGSVDISGTAEVRANTATSGNGGAICADTGAVTMSGGKLYANTAANGNGGAIYANTGSATMSGGTIGGTDGANQAKNGSGVYINAGTGGFSGGEITKNTATEGGAVGVGGEQVQLNFSGTITISENVTNDETRNVYLDQDTDGVINTSGFQSGASVGIYVPGNGDLFNNRGVMGAQFGISSVSSNSPLPFHNDRENSLQAIVDATTLRVYWSHQLPVEVRYIASYANGLPNGTNGDQKYSNSNYYPASGSAAISVLADELRDKCSNLSSSAVYATALAGGDSSYSNYLTRLIWEDGKWKVEKRDGQKIDLGSQKIVIYYSEPAYLSIENNSKYEFDISSLKVTLSGQEMSVLNSSSLVGYGLVFAKNGAIQKELFPVQVDEAGKLVLAKEGGSVNILIPGGRNLPYALDGAFKNGGTDTVRLRRNGVDEPRLPAAERVTLSGSTFNNDKTYEIVFGEDRYICKIMDTEGEHRFSTLKKAVEFAQSSAYKLNENNDRVTIEMLVDYLEPSTDAAEIIDSKHHFNLIEFTTAKSGQYRYDGDRATISRGNGNESPLFYVSGNVGTSGQDTETNVKVHDLNFDGKSLAGKCEGGAISTKDCKVDVSNADFVNFVAYNGGAIFISYGTASNASRGGTKKYTFASDYNSDNATLTVHDINVTSCTAKYEYGRSGGGAIWTNAKTFSVKDCEFANCNSDGTNMQGGAIFHRIEAQNTQGLPTTPYFESSTTRLTNCNFTKCEAQAGGAVESDACDIQIQECTFTNCDTTAKDGGAVNVYIFEQDRSMTYNSIPSKLTMKDCTLVSCISIRNGGAVRSMAVDNTFEGCKFTNTTAAGNGKGGGAIYVSNNRSVTTTVTGCTFTGATSNNGPGGAICTYSKELRVSGTTIANCQSKNSSGGGIYHVVTSSNYDGHVNNVGSFVSLVDCGIAGCTASVNGGGLYTNAFNARTYESTLEGPTYDINAVASNAEEAVKLLVGCTIENCKASTKFGGGVYLDSDSMSFATIDSSTIKDCTSNWSGGGLYSKAQCLTVIGTKKKNTVFKDCVSGAKGGGIFHARGSSTVNIAYCTIDSCRATENGGGFFTNNASSLSFSDCSIKNSITSGNTTDNGNGGGINIEKDTASLTLTNTTVSGNKANNKGGGIYTKGNMTMYMSYVTGNELLHNTMESAAGVYMLDGKTLTIGDADKAGDDDYRDNSSIMGNVTAKGVESNLRLPEKNGVNDSKVFVNCNLGPINETGGYFGVVNAKKVGTQFGTSRNSTTSWWPDGFTDQDAVFHADKSTLHGIIDRTDNSRKKIIWAGPPVCKITDADGRLLYFKKNGSDPAIFDVLADGSRAGSRTSAFSLLQQSTNLYYADGTQYYAENQTDPVTFSVKMLVENYDLTSSIITVDSENMTIIFTTAGKDDTDGYPFDEDASGTRATIARGAEMTGSMVVARANMQFRNILLDGGDTLVNGNGAIIQVAGSKNTATELQANAVLQYGRATNGGAVAVTNGNFTISNGLIRFCNAVVNNGAGGAGGAVYMSSATNAGATKGFFRFTDGNIQQCNAVDGAGVYVNDGVFNMSGGTISGCAASGSGGGVFVADGKHMNMSGGKVGYDAANTAKVSGGGIAVGGENSVLHFSRQVYVTRNTCDASEATGKICNVELNLDTKNVITTEGLFGRSVIGVYVPGHRDDDHPENDSSPYKERGGEGDPFGTYAGSSSQLYCFVNDRNGLKGGLIATTDPAFEADTIYWIKIFSVEVSKQVETSNNVPSDIKQAGESASFEYTVRLWNTNENVSGITVADIAAEIAEAKRVGEESKFGDIPFETTSDPNVISATISLRHDEQHTAQNLPAGLGYDVTEHWTDGYANVPANMNTPINFKSGMVGENKDEREINPYVSVAAFTNLQAVCKITDASGNLLFRNPTSSTVKNGEQMPAVYKDLSDAYNVVNGGATLYRENGNVSYAGDYRIEMLVPEYLQPSTLSLTGSRKVTLTTASAEATDHFPYSTYSHANASSVSIIRRSTSFTSGSMLTLSSSSDLTLTYVKLDGNLVNATVAKGGIVFVPSGGKLSVTHAASLQNSRITGDGAGIYLADGSHLYLSGDPIFGGTDVDGYGHLFNRMGNFKIGTQSNQKNGGQNYTVAHQDIYLEENHENAPSSIVVSGNLSGENGSIWVWAEGDFHNKTRLPFARLGIAGNGGNLQMFRNARDDQTSENVTETYLYGTREGGQAGYVYWSGLGGSQRVVLRKIGRNDELLSGARFDVYRGVSTSVFEVTNDDGTTETLDRDNLVSGSDGVFWIGTLPAGTYYLHETTAPTGYTSGKWFYVIVHSSGVYESQSYSRRQDAEAAAEIKNEEIKDNT